MCADQQERPEPADEGRSVPELGILPDCDRHRRDIKYFEGLRDSIPTELKERLIINMEKAKTVELVKRAVELVGKESQYRKIRL